MGFLKVLQEFTSLDVYKRLSHAIARYFTTNPCAEVNKEVVFEEEEDWEEGEEEEWEEEEW